MPKFDASSGKGILVSWTIRPSSLGSIGRGISQPYLDMPGIGCGTFSIKARCSSPSCSQKGKNSYKELRKSPKAHLVQHLLFTVVNQVSLGSTQAITERHISTFFTSDSQKLVLRGVLPLALEVVRNHCHHLNRGCSTMQESCAWRCER